MLKVAIKRHMTATFSVLTVVFLCLIIISGLASLSALRQLSYSNYDTSGHAVVQLRLHYNLLLSELQVLEIEHPESSVENAKLQYDFVYQRLRNLPFRPPYNSFLTSPELARLEQIFSFVAAEADQFDSAHAADASSLIGVRDRLVPLSEEINKLAGRIIQSAGEYRDQRRGEITRSTQFLIWSIIGLVLTGAFFAFLFWRSQRSLRNQNRELAAASDELIKANQAKSEFLALMSHELRTPLNAIIGFSDMISHEVFGQIGDKKYIEYSNDIKQSGDHLLHLINGILDLSKIEAGKYQLEPSHFNLHAAMTDAIRIVALAGQGGSSRIKLSLSDDVGNLYADRRNFRQIMINILSNADKYTPIGSDIKVSASNNQDGSIDIRVADDGIGISEADIKHVLEPFGQSRQDSSLTHEGTGLGLAISKQLMELNGGTLSLTSEVGIGTTVLLHFPDQFTRLEVALE